MRNKKLLLFFAVVIILGVAGFYVTRIKQKSPSDEIVREIVPVMGSIKTFISCTGTVLPKNRLEIKPPVNGRIEDILVQEGEKVKTGQTLAWMSSTERAALLDAARGKGEEDLKYWEDTYKPIPLLAPIDAEVIVAKTQPGQTITTADAVLVLSDQLIVRAQVDETDIGKITPDMKAIITLDAYPDIKINSSVEHIYYESKTVNNVTIYEVDLTPREAPAFFRSGMNASVDFIEQGRENALLIPQDAVSKDNDENYVLVKQDNGKEPLKVSVKLGISDDKNVEIISGIKESDRIILKTKKYSLPKSSTTGSNPFMPSRRR
ncbi:MAG: HlyD family efflux transporter periplasmic adaptor subunit [Candidatus Omnitrophica bacterium]|nr:HlyD family efflux transporter periplasmic adaptor subunit [Candidatus Omnitrophota bacterium]MDD5352086.1 HlyD family efflux transporter periplasmic adaptor subunit [Candidatus Omnitrophota bacterium]MDD5549684.1 HlyD family efflux transporter periplasmic adaptor subunit [Candidatus Omnitrophota bacterium]